MYISQEYKGNNGYKSDDNVQHIEPDKLSAFKKKFKKQERQLRKWEVNDTHCVGSKRRKVPNKLSIEESNQQYADVCVMVKVPKTGKEKILFALLDSGCTKPIILQKFTSPQVRTRLIEKDCYTYNIYGGHFPSSSVALVAFRLVEIDKNKNLLINYMFQVDEVKKSKDS